MMLLTAFLSFLCFLILLLLTAGAQTPERGLFLILSVCCFYYGMAGPLFWAIERDGVFLSVDWFSALPFTSFCLLAGTLYWAACVSVLQSKSKYYESGTPAPSLETGCGGNEYLQLSRLNNPTKFFLLIGGAGAIYTLINSFISGKTHETGNPFFLIAYQFSDALIPALLYLFATSRNVRQRIPIVFVYMLFAILVGFRYKMALFVGPLLLYAILWVPIRYQSGPARLSAYGMMAASGLLIIGLFSLLTLIREPFQGVDVSRLGDTRQEQDFLYALFAESNTIFALAAIQERIIPEGSFYYLTPIVDALQELVPRFLYPSRITGAYLADVLHGMMSTEAMTSGTAYPYLGEIFLMGGYLAAVLLIPLLAFWTTACIRSISNSSASLEAKIMGFAIVGVYFGYYYFSRGYFAQSFKGFLFVLLPFILMCRASPTRR